LCGLGILICGVLVEVNWRTMTPYSLLKLGIIVPGGITFVIALFGCFDAIRKNRPVFITFGIFISIVLVVQIAFSIYFSVLLNQTKRTEVEHQYEKLFNEYHTDPYVYDWVNSVQDQMNCCGIDRPEDFLSILNATEEYPWSCCEAKNRYKLKEACESSNAHRLGCRDYVFVMVISKPTLLSRIIHGISAVELIGIIFAIFLACTIRNDKRRVMTD
ncbi:hypothetical protein PV326_012536, partial [Microctonus aethiopoides]